MPSSPPRTVRPFRRWLRDNALALWLWGLALLGILRFLTRAMRHDGGADAVAWAYLGGGVLVGLAGVVTWARRPLAADRNRRLGRPD